MTDNLFSSLRYYTGQSQENYLIEVFRYVIRILLERDLPFALDFLNWLCQLQLKDMQMEEIKLVTQLELNNGQRPDLIIFAPDTTVYIEIKDWAKLSPRQLESYDEELRLAQTRTTTTRLVFILRYAGWAGTTTLSPERFHEVYWNQIHGRLSIYKGEVVTEFVVHEFMNFLENRRFVIRKIPGFEGDAVRKILKKLIDQSILEAFPEVGRTGKKTLKSGKKYSWYSHYMKPENVWYGFRYMEPHKVILKSTNNIGLPFYREIDLEQKHFLEMEPPQQLMCLANFLVQSLRELDEKMNAMEVKNEGIVR